MTNRALDQLECEFFDRDVGVTFIIQEGLIRVHTYLTYTEQLSVMVSVNGNAQWMIGRSNRCAIVLNNSTISRQHAVLGYDRNSGFYVMDCISHNSTFLNQIRLTPLQRYKLNDRDTLSLNGQTIQINIVYKNQEVQ